ncbi:LAMI_0F02850g1_1 [Lachancea mirantina]|uniref:LAMI_0F02850g1_1 n=1 Tax=Lachancea mirantina TaxID=1230905 RepID=A0A1G4JWR1_9SACH|nr:LAMI_0F02850g1_1 [Lachancea mirantina]
MGSRESSVDSDLERDRTTDASSCESDDNQQSSRRNSLNEGTDSGSETESLIGGSTVVGHQKIKKVKRRPHTIYDESEDEGSSDKEELPDIQDSQEVDKHNHRIFTFNLPFGGKNLLPTSPLSTLKNTLLPRHKTQGVKKNEDKLRKYNRKEIKEKLVRQETITSIEELKLFQDEKGIDNVRAMAVKRVFAPEALFHTIRGLSINPNQTTHDGYSKARIETIWEELEGDIVILGGYRGSILRDVETKRRAWIPIRAGLNIRKVDLLIGPRDEDEFETQKHIYPDGMLTHLGPVDVASRLIKRLRNNPRVNIEDFGFDWRLSLDIPAKQLAEKLQDIHRKQRVKRGTYIIAHSMGGLIAHKVLQEHTSLVRGIIYVGAPSQCPNILGPLRFGDEVIFNKSILSAEANFFMRSSFYFLPFDGRCFVNKATFERYDLDFFDPNVWYEYGLSPLVSDERSRENSNSSSPSSEKDKDKDKDLFSILSHVDMIRKPSIGGSEEKGFKTSLEDSKNYLERTLKRTRVFLEELQYDKTKQYPPLAMVYGNRVPTVRGAKVSGLQQIKDGIYDEFYYGPGDGVVHHKWLLPERRGFPVVAKVASECAHVSLMTDFEAMAKAFISLVDAENIASETARLND